MEIIPFIWDYFHFYPQDFFSILILIYFLKYETIVSRSSLSLGYSDTSSVHVNYLAPEQRQI